MMLPVPNLIPSIVQIETRDADDGDGDDDDDDDDVDRVFANETWLTPWCDMVQNHE